MENTTSKKSKTSFLPATSKAEFEKRVKQQAAKMTLSPYWDNPLPKKAAVRSEETKKKEKAYWDRISKMPRNRIYSPPKAKKKPIMILDKAKKIVWSMIQEKMEGKEYVLDGNLKSALSVLTAYFSNNQQGRLDLNKGIWLYGPVGTGKTFLMELFQDFAKRYNPDLEFRRCHIRDVTDTVINGDRTISYYCQGNWAFDDVGFERAIKIYGNLINPFEDIITKTYDRFKRNSRMLFCTSNMPIKSPDNESVVTRYGERISDRCREMMNPIYLHGESKRL